MCINQLPRPCGENGKAARQHHGSLMNNLSQHCNLDKTWNKWGDKSRSISLQLIYIKNSELMECKNSGSSKHVSSNQLCFHMFLRISSKVIGCASARTLPLLVLLTLCCQGAERQIRTHAVICPACHQVSVSRLSVILSFCFKNKETPRPAGFIFPVWLSCSEFYTQWYWFVFKSWLMALLLAKIACIKYL